MIGINRLLYYFMLILSISLSVIGCAENDFSNEPSDGPLIVPFKNLSYEDQVYLARTVIERSMDIFDFTQTMANSIEICNILSVDVESETAINTDDIRIGRSISVPPDTFWIGPDANSWYTYTREWDLWPQNIHTRVINVRWTPDAWIGSLAMEPISKLELTHSYTVRKEDEERPHLEETEAIVLEVNDTRTHVDGTVSNKFRYITTTWAIKNVVIDMKATCSNVSIDAEDLAGDYSFDLDTVRIYDYEEEFWNLFTVLTITYSFDPDGSGDGSAYFGSEEVIRIAFSPPGFESNLYFYHGTFFLASENFRTQHRFGDWGVGWWNADD